MTEEQKLKAQLAEKKFIIEVLKGEIDILKGKGIPWDKAKKKLKLEEEE